MKTEAVSENWRDDYYRMTGEFFRADAKSILQLLVSHQIRYVKLWRKASLKMTPLRRLCLLHYARKYGLEIAPSAKLGKGIYLGHPYNITVGGGWFWAIISTSTKAVR